MAPMMRLPGDEQKVVVCEEGNCTYLTSWLTAPFRATEAGRRRQGEGGRATEAGRRRQGEGAYCPTIQVFPGLSREITVDPGLQGIHERSREKKFGKLLRQAKKSPIFLH